MEKNRRGLKMKMCLTDKVYVSEKKKIMIDTLSVNEGSTILCWNINERRGEIANKQCIKEREMNFVDT
jgi:hypothetical protein